MLSFWSKIFQGNEKERDHKRDLLQIENSFLDQEPSNDSKDYNNGNSSPNSLQMLDSAAGTENNKLIGTSCSARKGVITFLTEQNGIIDKSIAFKRQAAGQLFHELTVGSVIEYLTYQQEDGVSKVIKIQKIIDQSWEETTDNKVAEVLESLKLVQPVYFKTQLRNILGNITQRLPTAIVVDTDYGELNVDLDNIESNFIPKTGDEITLICNVQLDDGYVDKQGEILGVKKIFPTRIEPDQKCTVERVFEEFAELTNAYVLKEDVPKGIQLHLGDIVKVDLIECKHSKFSRRAIKLSVLEKNFGQIKNNPLNASTGTKRAVSIEGEDRFVFTEQWKKHHVTLKVRNVGKRTFELVHIDIPNASDAQISVVEPVSSRSIEMGGHISLIFEVHTRFIGESKEYFTLHFDTFKVARFLTVVVCTTEEDALEAKRRLIASEQLMVSGRTARQRSRHYAYQVYSNKSPLVPGESIATKRRFVPVHLSNYDVPEKLCNIVLKTESMSDVRELLGVQYPFLNESFAISNYVQRFATMLHLEEIDYNVNFRNYDRERAHFNREGEYLSLQIENLAERRPSLVLGDTVNAINPWVEPDSKENKLFQGVVHKVFFNRVHLKFNANFQQKYNGEDYRLEFHFSRFAFRKQHHATSRIGGHMGENFLFPSKVAKRDHVQLEVEFKEDNMYLYDDKLSWFNEGLNCIQKRAVYNVLRGETENMPYVIFGPPGTGKTVTLVETILQLVRHVPGSRLLVGTPSNSSADLITKRIIASKALNHGEFIRLVSQNQVEKDLVPPELASYCATVDIGTVDSDHDSMIITESGLKLRCQAKYLGKHRITISTCTTLGNFIQMDFLPEHFTHVLIDEAGQCTEPETMVPIVLLARKRSQVVLAGDPHQLQAIVTSRYANELGLGMSYLERLLETSPYRRDMQRFPKSSGYNPSVLTKLLYNYRALPSIMNVYSKLFYDNELISMVSDKDSREVRFLAELQEIFEAHQDRPRTHGTFFHGIMGENLQDFDSPSWYNPAEAREVFLLTILLYRRNVHHEQIGILTPYAKQVKTLRTMFIAADLTMPKIGSVEEFQGQERDIMLISTVRSSESNLRADARLSLGFVRCNKRMNVAISRARCLMVIFGNPKLLAVDDCWRHLILFCANNNAYFGCEMPASITAQGDDSDGNESDVSDLVP
ncbi:probable RNA helicase armi [Drosophila montana]|uniref:probable RNA helicase armi n=1 Tax=Drosophila montana TaxID=40370 RepID=UPI00313C9442